jgi:Transposase IS66 family
VRRDFLHLRLGGPEQEAWADGWIERIGQLYELNAQRLTLAKSPNGPAALPALFVALDPARMSRAEYAQADAAVHQALAGMEQQSAQELAQSNLGRLRRKVLTSLQTHWQGLTLFADHPQIPMDNNGAERAIRPGTIGRKNYQELRTVLTCHLLDEVSNRAVDEVAFEFIPTGNQATGASLLQLEEGPQGAEDMIANGPFPAHEELLRVAGLLNGSMVSFNGPVLLADVHEVTLGDFHALFFCGSYCA